MMDGDCQIEKRVQSAITSEGRNDDRPQLLLSRRSIPPPGASSPVSQCHHTAWDRLRRSATVRGRCWVYSHHVGR